MLPNMKSTIKKFSQSFTYVKVVVYDGGFEDTKDDIEYVISGVIQIPQDKTLQALDLDVSISYRQVHIPTDTGVTPRNNDLIKFNNKNFKVIKFRDFSDYGYYEFIVEEVLNGGY